MYDGIIAFTRILQDSGALKEYATCNVSVDSLMGMNG